MSTKPRTGESKPANFRSDRFCQINGMWYFITRERTQEGPFHNRTGADLGAQRYIASKLVQYREVREYRKAR